MNEPKRIIYRGVRMIESWPEKIRAAQAVVSYKLDGKSLARVRYGHEQDDWHADTIPCHDCGGLKDEFHVTNCDVEECPECGGQFISCDCPFDEREQ